MTNLIIGLGVVLILVILYLIFRVGNLVGLARRRDVTTEPRVDSSNSINAGLFLAFTLIALGVFFWYSYSYFDEYTLPIASVHGAWTDTLFWITMAVTVVAFSAISIVMAMFVFKFQHKEGRRAKFYPDNHYLELAWTIIPAIVLTILIFTGLSAWNDITGPASADAEVIEVVGQQFAWTARYPGNKDNKLGSYNFQNITAINEFGLNLKDKNSFDDFKSLELHIPKGKEILIKIRAKDVLHSFYLPHFRVKMDAVPGMPTQFKFVATKTTQEMRDELNNADFNYELACAELCGQAHFSMKMIVVVEEQAAYDQWKQSQESWLKLNPDQMKYVPAELREAAMVKAGLQKDPGIAVAGTKVE
jgi:cytochrome c oxidase subunit 2